MFCGMASLAVSSALWMTATSANPIGIQVAQQFGVEIGFGKWLITSSVPALIAILLLPRVIALIFPGGRRNSQCSCCRPEGTWGAGSSHPR